MAKTYYDWLEVSPIASPEVIEKAYKALVKKYHPDLQEANHKEESENKLKHINEAYEILIDPHKRNDYDNWLTQNQNSEKTNSSSIDPINIPLEDLKNIERELELEQDLKLKEKIFQKELQQAKQKAYHDAYIQDLKYRGYKIKTKHTWRNYIKVFIFLIITLTLLWILLQLPFVQTYLYNLWKNNPLLKNLNF